MEVLFSFLVCSRSCDANVLFGLTCVVFWFSVLDVLIFPGAKRIVLLPTTPFSNTTV